MGVAPRRLDVAVIEQLADHRLGFAERERTGRKAVPQVVLANIPVGLMLVIGSDPYDPTLAGVIASANGWRRLVRAVAKVSSLAARTTTICS